MNPVRAASVARNSYEEYMRYRWIPVVLLATAVGHSQETASNAAVEAPVGLVVKKGDVRSTSRKQGRFVPADATEIKLKFDAYSARMGVQIAFVAPQGSFVNKGDVIARLKTRGIDEQIERDQMSLDRSTMALRHSEAKFEMQEASNREQLERAEIDAARAAKRLEGFRKHEKKFNEESERLGVQARSNRLADQKAELDQLERMYGEDELVDATEEIVIMRSRRDFARSKATNELSTKRREYNNAWYKPWTEEDLVRTARVKAASLERLRKSQAMSRERRSLDLEHQRHGLKKQREKFAKLRADREKFTVRAPRGGILLHGSAKSAPGTAYTVDGSARVGGTFATIAGDKAYDVKLELTEKDLRTIRAGSAAIVAPVLTPNRKMAGRLEIEFLPKRGGKFDAMVRITKNEMRLRPGLTADIEIVLKEERDAVRVLKSFLKKDGGKYWVKAGSAMNGPFEMREVTIGATDATYVAIRTGLNAGEYVVKP